MNIAASRRTQFHTRTQQSDSKIDLDLLVCSAHTLSPTIHFHYILSLHTLNIRFHTFKMMFLIITSKLHIYTT
jgi:hypothetical protein